MAERALSGGALCWWAEEQRRSITPPPQRAYARVRKPACPSGPARAGENEGIGSEVSGGARGASQHTVLGVEARGWATSRMNLGSAFRQKSNGTTPIADAPRNEMYHTSIICITNNPPTTNDWPGANHKTAIPFCRLRLRSDDVAYACERACERGCASEWVRTASRMGRLLLKPALR